MFTVTLNKKTYKVEHVSTKALYELGPVEDFYRRMKKAEEAEQSGGKLPDFDYKKDIGALVDWFVLFCGNQFSSEDMMEYYPSDRIITDVGTAAVYVKSQLTSALEHFPSGEEHKKKETKKTGFKRFLTRFIGT